MKFSIHKKPLLITSIIIFAILSFLLSIGVSTTKTKESIEDYKRIFLTNTEGFEQHDSAYEVMINLNAEQFSECIDELDNVINKLSCNSFDPNVLESLHSYVVDLQKFLSYHHSLSQEVEENVTYYAYRDFYQCFMRIQAARIIVSDM